MDDSVLAEFEKEIEFMQRTRHTNIVRFFGAGFFPDGTPFLVEELMVEGSLKGFLRSPQNRGLPWAQKVSFACDVARGMHHIHSLGHLHRDLKSGNVLVTSRRQAKVADFGSIGRLLCHGKDGGRKQGRGGGRGRAGGGGVDIIANRPSGSSGGDSSSGSGASGCGGDLTVGVGTPLYMSLEMLRGAEYGQATDTWSFGVLLWELATQQQPDLLAQEGKSGSRGPMLGMMLQLLEGGCRLRLGETCPFPEYPVLMESCWEAVPAERPRFGPVLKVLTGLLDAAADSTSSRGGADGGDGSRNGGGNEAFSKVRC